MKKLIVLTLVFALSMGFVGSAVAVTQQTINVGTGLVRSEGGGADPIIKAKWEMLRESGGWHWIVDPSHSGGGYWQLDDSTAAGAQFAPTGIWGTPDGDMKYTVCAIVTDPNGVADIDGVYADIYYPENIAFHHPGMTTYNITPVPVPVDPVNGNGTTDYGIHGCGEFIEENTLYALDKMEGYDLFCDVIYNDNNNLPTFFTDASGYVHNYSEICGPVGELMKEEAYVYCDDKTLIWEDPAGDYTVEIFALDNAGNFSYDHPNDPIDSNHFEYLPLVGFEVDFDTVTYGDVMLNVHKIISGDLTWDGPLTTGVDDNPASVRNIGNKRLFMWVEQDDMGLGQTSGAWNVQYDARVGNEVAEWKVYNPEVNKKLQDILDLSELEEMDFSIEIFKFPSTQTNYSGSMVLSATAANFRICVPD